METPVAPGVAVEVDVGRVDRELRQLWAAGTSGPVIRACSLNLVVILWDLLDADAIRDAVVRVTETHPARAIIVDASDRMAPPLVRSWICYRCQPPGLSGARVCHEEISVAVQGDAVTYLDTVVFSVLAADTPRFLWWSGSLPESAEVQRVFGHITEQCDRLMVDTGRITDAPNDLVALSALTLAEEHRAALGDLNWHRLTPWRRLLSEAFDPVDMREQLHQVDGGTITWEAPNGAMPVQVLLFLGWLAASLGWVFTACQQRRQAFFMRGAQVIAFELLAQRAEKPGLLQVELFVPDAVVSIQMTGDDFEQVTRLQQREPHVSVVPAPRLDLAAAVEAELGMLGRNPRYEAALQMAERLARVL